ncbi:MAG: diguanylate cyclase, partial [Pseudoxanthomonas sp.]
FWNELSISPIFDSNGKVTNFIGIQKDVTTRILVEERLLSSNVSLEDRAGELAVLVMADGLTGIYNRRFFDAQLDIQWKIACRNVVTLALVIVDIDHFKAFNDIHGHQAGDMALRAVAQSLDLSFTRSSDFVARYGGEEFAILSTGMSNPQAKLFATALCERVRALHIAHAGSPTGYLTISAGYAVHTFAQAEPAGQLVKMADEALYLAKEQGRDRCVGYDT